MKSSSVDLTTTKVQYVIDRDDLEIVLRDIVSETISEKSNTKPAKECFLTAKHVAEKLGVTKTTLWRWEKENYLKPVRFGSKLRYRESDIIALMEGGDDE